VCYGVGEAVSGITGPYLPIMAVAIVALAALFKRWGWNEGLQQAILLAGSAGLLFLLELNPFGVCVLTLFTNTTVLGFTANAEHSPEFKRLILGTVLMFVVIQVITALWIYGAALYFPIFFVYLYIWSRPAYSWGKAKKQG
jgi:thiol:disulfide interchange protein